MAERQQSRDSGGWRLDIGRWGLGRLSALLAKGHPIVSTVHPHIQHDISFQTPTHLFLGVVCHVNFARLREGGRAGLLTHCHPVPRFVPHYVPLAFRSGHETTRRGETSSLVFSYLPNHPPPYPSLPSFTYPFYDRRAREEMMQIWPTLMKGLTELPAINMLIVFESRDSGLWEWLWPRNDPETLFPGGYSLSHSTTHLSHPHPPTDPLPKNSIISIVIVVFFWYVFHTFQLLFLFCSICHFCHVCSEYTREVPLFSIFLNFITVSPRTKTKFSFLFKFSKEKSLARSQVLTL